MDRIPMNFAPLGKRFFGAIIDIFILLPFNLPLAIHFGLIDFDTPVELTIYKRLLMFAIMSTTFVIANLYLLLKRGQTIGKLLVGTKIIDQHGNLLSIKNILIIRYVLFLLANQIVPIISIIDSIFIFGEERRTLHDRLAGSYVVRS